MLTERSVENIEVVREQYFRLVERIVFASGAHDAEQALAEAFELGRSLVNHDTLSPDDVVGLHHEAIIRLADSYPEMSLASVAEWLTRPMMEMSMAYGLAYGLAFREHEYQLAIRERQFRTLVENSIDNIARYDRDARILYANPTLARTLRMPVDKMLGKRFSELFVDGSFAAYEAAILVVAISGESARIEQSVTGGDGTLLTQQVQLVAEYGASGSVVGVLATGRDITDILYYQRKMHALAYIDGLTGLPNRTLFNDHIHQAAAEVAREGGQLGLMLLDLDNFKTVNDTLGHAVGDRLLNQAAQRLRASVRASDTVARFGGDEFVVILPNICDGALMDTIAGNILDTLTEPYSIEQHELFATASIGIAMYPADSDDIDTLLKFADSAMYHAKKQGRNNYQFYSPQLTAGFQERMALELALRKADYARELELHYQPQVDLLSGRIIGAEALLRWNRGAEGMLTPDRFIPLAEETGMIVEIGEWVLAEACATAVAWNRQRQIPLRMAVNLSTRQFIKNDLVASISRILTDTGCRPQWLKLEITESLLLEDSDEVLATLERLRALGLTIAIDDFGTGYSALSYLNRFPVSQIKIDRGFVRDITENRDKAELIKAMISIAQVLRLEVVAEGVETHRQAEFLHENGCRIAQGYLFGKPKSAACFAARLSAEHAAERCSVDRG